MSVQRKSKVTRRPVKAGAKTRTPAERRSAIKPGRKRTAGESAAARERAARQKAAEKRRLADERAAAKAAKEAEKAAKAKAAREKAAAREHAARQKAAEKQTKAEERASKAAENAAAKAKNARRKAPSRKRPDRARVENAGACSAVTVESIAGWIREAYLEATNGAVKERVLLKDLRPRVGVQREDFDQALLTMQRQSKVVLMGLDNPVERTPEVEAAALHIAGHPRHLVYFQG